MRAALVLLLAFALAAARAHESLAAEEPRSFTIYDNLFYRGKPNTARDGLVAANILYENKIWPNEQAFGVLPNRNAFESLVRLHVANPGQLRVRRESIARRAHRLAHRIGHLCRNGHNTNCIMILFLTSVQNLRCDARSVCMQW